MPPRSKKTRGDAGPSMVASIPDFPTVIFATMEQRERFLSLLGKAMLPTRFLCRQSMQSLGLNGMMATLFTGTGLATFYGMSELSYQVLTLEFLSSLEVDKATHIMKFRLLNKEFSIHSDDFGDLFNIIWNRDDSTDECIALPHGAIWRNISGKELVSWSQLRTNDVQHPALRIWLRTIIGTIYARGEKGSINQTELSLLGYHLHPGPTMPPPVDIPWSIIRHLDRVASGRIKEIEIGGLVTYIAKRITDFNANDHVPMTKAVPLIDTQYLISHHKWVSRVPSIGLKWKVNRSQSIMLSSVILPSVDHPPAGHTLPSFLIPLEDQAPTGMPAYEVAMDDDDIPPGFTTAPSGGSTGYASAYPDFPQDVGHRIYRQVNQDLTQYGMHHYLVQQGAISRDGPHPGFYHGPDGQYGGYPGGVFHDAGLPPAAWGPDFWQQYGGYGWNPNTTGDGVGGSRSRNDNDDDDMGGN